MDFKSLGVSSPLCKALAKAGVNKPTPIQAKAIPLAREGRDVMGLAQTGTGKTFAFGLPLVDHLLAHPEKPAPKHVRALILAPTRELVNQISENLNLLTFSTPVKVMTIVGGQSIIRQTNQLKRGAYILVATPGRLIDLMERGAVNLSHVKHLVLDEADQMLDMGFIASLRKIAARLGTPRQTMLFSATMPSQMAELSKAYLKNPKRVQVSPPGKAADKITQSVQYVSKEQKLDALCDILARDMDALTLVFGRTKHGVNRLCSSLVERGFQANAIHGNKSQNQRDRAIRNFRDAKTKILVATDVAARGIDIPGVAYVINYDLPEVPDSYVHRIGRTARAGREGEAITLCTSDDVELLDQIEKLMKIEIPVTSGRKPAATIDPTRRRGGGGKRSRGGSRKSPQRSKAQKSGKPGKSKRNKSWKKSGKPRSS